jgi:hypothetical protein
MIGIETMMMTTTGAGVTVVGSAGGGPLSPTSSRI